MGLLLLITMLFATAAPAANLAQTQAAIKAQGANWTAGVTSMSHLSDEEFAAMCNLDLSIPEGAVPIMDDVDESADIPVRLDWSNIDGKDFSTPVKQQHPCGTCATFSTLGVFEALIKIAMDNPFIMPDLSEQQVRSCAGVLPLTLWHPNRTLRDDGAADDECMPYQCNAVGQMPPCEDRCADWDNRVFKSTDYQVHMFISNEKIKQLLQNGPLVAGFQVTQGFQEYIGGVFEPTSKVPIGGHGVGIFGYDDEGGYWICKNSWGEEWGENGWFKYKYGEGMLKFAYMLATIDVDTDTLCGTNTAPQIAALSMPGSGQTIAPDQDLTFSFDYEDFEANLAGGELFYSLDGASPVRYAEPAVELIGTSSSEKDAATYLIPGPFDPGQHTLTVFVKDLCAQESNELNATFTVEGADDDDDTGDDDDDSDDGDGDDDDDNDDDNDNDDDGCGC